VSPEIRVSRVKRVSRDSRFQGFVLREFGLITSVLETARRDRPGVVVARREPGDPGSLQGSVSPGSVSRDSNGYIGIHKTTFSYRLSLEFLNVTQEKKSDVETTKYT
jgi:hypothetical protein